MHLGPARQGCASAHGRVIADARRITKANHPLVVHGQKFQNGNKEFRFVGPGTHRRQIRSGRPEKDAHEVILPRDPTQCLQRYGLGCFLLHLLSLPALETLC